MTDKDHHYLRPFEPRKRLDSPTVIVTPVEDPLHPARPLSYFVNGYQRHHEKLSGMAGDWVGNRAVLSPRVDKHTETASRIYSISPGQVSAEQRRVGKLANFSQIYS